MQDERQNAMNPTVVKLGLVSMFADVAGEMLYPVIPIFLTSVLGASKFSVGLVEGFAEFTASLLKTYSGVWSDRLGRRKPFIVAGYSLAALAKPAIALAGSWPHVLIARALDRTGKGLRGGPRDAMIAEAVVPELRGAAFGWHRAMDTLGAAIGPLLAMLYLTYLSQNLRMIFLWAAIPGVLAAIIALSVKEQAQEAKPHDERPKFKWRELPRPFLAYAAVWAIFSLGNSSDAFLLLKAREKGLTLNQTILSYCLYNLIYALLSPSLGKLSDRWGRKHLLLGGFFVFAFVYAGFGWATQVGQFAALFAIYGLYMAATDGVGKAFAVDLVQPQFKATAVGLLGTVTGVSMLIGSASVGLLWDRFGTGIPFYFGSAMAAVACGALVFLKIPRPSSR